MILIVSDLHLGKYANRDEISLSDLLACVEHYAEEVKELVFLGDTFDAFLEYPNHIPTFVTQWGSLVKQLKDRGVNISYFAGNHDRWHRSVVRDLLGQPVRQGPAQRIEGNRKIWMEHGDQADQHSPLVRLIRAVTGHRMIFKIFTGILPFGGAQIMASWISRHFAGLEPKPKTVRALNKHAQRILKRSMADLVIMGHCHEASISSSESGSYINTGDWYEGRTYVCIRPVEGQVTLEKWTANGPQERSMITF